MKIVLQRVLNAKVEVDNKITGQINKGYLIFLGVGHEDTKADAERIVNKIVNMRIFSDDNDKINLSLADVSGELLVVSQFTLYADCKKGNRPNFINAAKPDTANELYEYFVELCRKKVPVVQTGVFGADMKVSLTNDGPFTILLD